MGEPYYSQRLRSSRQTPRPPIGRDFWTAFQAYIRRLSYQNFLCEEFGEHCSDGYPKYHSDDAVAGRLREELGEVEWPVPPERKLGTSAILDLVEFFSRYVSRPTDSWFHEFCGASHPNAYDSEQGRLEYAAEVNGMFRRFNHPYVLREGLVGRVGSTVMENRFATVDFRTGDDHLTNLVSRALEAFHDRSSERRMEALNSIVDAFERVKTLESADKKSSVQKLLAKLSESEDICAHFDQHLRYLTDFANTHAIRHHETDRVVLKDPLLIEYLFYSYYTLLVFILGKLESGAISGSHASSERV